MSTDGASDTLVAPAPNSPGTSAAADRRCRRLCHRLLALLPHLWTPDAAPADIRTTEAPPAPPLHRAPPEPAGKRGFLIDRDPS